jgi:hypothetical protein
MVMAVDVKPSMGKRKWVAERIEAGLCLQCDDESARGRLGCCKHHYNQFRNDMMKLPLAERELYRAREIRAGRIAASTPGKRTDLQRAS